MCKMIVFLGSPVARCAKHAERDLTFHCLLSVVRQRFPCGRAAFQPVVVPGIVGHAYAQSSHQATRRLDPSKTLISVFIVKGYILKY
jgi:hypothetical protein